MLVDVHAHLHFKEFLGDVDEVVARARAAGVVKIVDSGTDHANNVKALGLASRFDVVEASVGVYPTDVVALSDEALESEVAFIRENRERIVAVGEVGLDYKFTPEGEGRRRQKAGFLRFLELAEELRKPVVLHTREAERDVVEVVESTSLKRVVFHCFMGNYKLVKRVVDRGWFFSIPPIIVRTLHFQGLVKLVPVSQLLTETDAPYLAPPPKQRNEPAFVARSVEKIAELKSLDVGETARMIFQNYQRVFG